MRHQMPLAIAFSIVAAAAIRGQERIPLPPPDPTIESPSPSLASPPAPATPPTPPTPLTVPPSPPAQLSPAPYPPLSGPYAAPVPYPPYGQGDVYGPGVYGPPPGMYGPAPRVIVGDPVGNPRFWFGIDTIIWWSKNQPLSPPVVTTGPASQGANAGGIGTPGTTSLNAPLNYGAEGGLRLYAGGWLESSHTWGLDGSLFFLGRQDTGFSVYDRSQNGSFVINEPVAGAPFSTQVSAPGVQTGGVSVDATSRLWGADVNGLFNLFRSDGWSLNLLGGFRYLQLNEDLNIVANSALFTTTNYTDNLGNLLVSAPPGSTVTVIDQFGTRNDFYGGQVGARLQYVSNRWSFGATTTLAIGSTHETVTINGSTNVFPVNGNPVSLGGGNFATIQSGRYSTDKFAVAPGAQINLGYQITPFMRGIIGYNFLYLSSVARPGNQIDNSFDGVVHPIVPMASSSFWSQGITLAIQLSF